MDGVYPAVDEVVEILDQNVADQPGVGDQQFRNGGVVDSDDLSVLSKHLQVVLDQILQSNDSLGFFWIPRGFRTRFWCIGINFNSNIPFSF